MTLIAAEIRSLAGGARRQPGKGFTYVIAFGTGVVKVGFTADPAKRVVAHFRSAHAHGTTVEDAWISQPQTDARLREQTLIDYCRRNGTPMSTEYFIDISFGEVVAFATALELADLIQVSGEYDPKGPDEITERTGLTAAQRRMRSQVANHTRWATEPDRARATRPALDGFLAKFEREVDPDGVLSPEERAVRATAARKAHMARIRLASSKKATARKGRAA